MEKKRTEMSKENDRNMNRKMTELEDVERDIAGIRKDRKREKKKLMRKRKFMLDKPFCQTSYYQCYPAPSSGFFCSQWPSKPYIPRDLKIVETKARSVNLQWDTEDFSGAVIDKYETWMRGKVRANSKWKKVRNCDWLPGTYDILFHNRTKRIVKTSACGLSPETFYQFKTRAHNPGGWSEFSEISEWARTESIGYCGETRPYKEKKISQILEEVSESEGCLGMLNIIKKNPYTIKLLIGALKFLIRSCESSNKNCNNNINNCYDNNYYSSHYDNGSGGAMNNNNSRDNIITSLLDNGCVDMLISRLNYHPKHEEINGLGMKLLGLLSSFNNLTRRHVVHTGGILLANKIIETFWGHWKAGSGVAKLALWAKEQMQSHMTEVEASLIVQKYIRKMRARKYLEKLREARAIEKLKEEDKHYDPIYS